MPPGTENVLYGIRAVNDHSDSNNSHRCGFVAIVGLPNTGKSTLMNRYLREKVSIVSPKPQTTRTNVSCILSASGHQVIFVDTPGILKPKYRMQETMTTCVANAVSGADVILVLFDASTYRDSIHPELVNFSEKIDVGKVVVALNKIDLVKKELLLVIIEKMAKLFPDADIVPISALDGSGTDELLSVLLEKLPVGPSLYSEDIISSEPERFFVSEIIREAVFHTMEQEIPYASAVIIDSFKEKTAKVVIHATILVEKKSQKPIIIGKGGSMIKRIGIMARQGIETFLGKDVYLELYVKVSDDWRNRQSVLREIGLIKR